MANIDNWEIVGDTTIIVDALASETWDRQLGASEPQTLRFYPAGRATDHKTRAEAVQEYGKFAGTAVVNRTDGGGVTIRERVASAAPVDSHIVKIAPSPTQPDTQFEGIWGLVESVASPNFLTNTITLEVELTYLGDASEYADRSAVETALTGSVI